MTFDPYTLPRVFQAHIYKLNLQNCATLSCDRPSKRNLREHTKLR